MKNAHDQFHKRLLHLLLSRAGRCETSKDIYHPHLDAQQSDVYFEPDPHKETELEKLGLLGRLCAAPCLLEPFSRTPGIEPMTDCVRKQLNLRKQQEMEQRARPYAIDRPMLWIISAGDPKDARSELLFAPWDKAPRGKRLGGVYQVQLAFRIGLVVVAHLESWDQPSDTRVLRLMGSGQVQRQAMHEVAQMPKGTIERDEIVHLLLEYKGFVGGLDSTQRVPEQEDFMSNAQQLADEIEERGRREGKADTVLKQLRLKYGQAVTPEIEDKVHEASIEQLDRYSERVLTQTSLQATLSDN